MAATVDDASLVERVASLGIWSGPVTPRILDGGITNKNFIVEDQRGKFVVRTGGDIAVHGIVRASELRAAKAAEAAGITPPVIHAEEGLTVIRFIDGRTLTPDDVRDAKNLERLVRLIRDCHRRVAQHLRGPAPMFWPFHVIRDYAHTLVEGRSRYAVDMPGLLAKAQQLEAAVGRIDVVFGHNDLLAANILDDGSKLWLIDWEYAGFNSPLFDLGGLASNSEMPPELVKGLVECYFERPLVDRMQVKLAAMTAASLLRETLWAMVSELYSKVAFDYAAYTRENRARFDRSFATFADMTKR